MDFNPLISGYFPLHLTQLKEKMTLKLHHDTQTTDQNRFPNTTLKTSNGTNLQYYKAMNSTLVETEPQHSCRNICKENKDSVKCSICKLSFSTRKLFYHHKTTKHHLVEFLKYWLKRNEKDLLQDKYGISISCLEQSGCIPKLVIQTCPNQYSSVTFCISNNGTEKKNGKVSFRNCEFLHKLQYLNLHDKYKVTEEKGIVIIPPHVEYHVTVTAKFPHVGQYIVPLAFQFCLEGDGHPFHIVRWIVLQCGNSIVLSVQPTLPYQPHSLLITRPPAKTVIKGTPSNKHKILDRLEKDIPLSKYKIPEELKILTEHNLKQWQGMTKRHSMLLEVCKSLLKQTVKAHTYCEYFETLIYLEEIQMEIDVRNYDLADVLLQYDRSNKHLIELEVPGLAENRPSIMTGDHLFVRFHDCSDDIEYEGIVERVQSTKVLLRFGQKFLLQFIDSIKVDVRFTVSTWPFQLMIRAVHLIQEWNMLHLLFPVHSPTIIDKPLVVTADISFFNRQIEDNPEQQLAVKTILAGTSRPTPYLLFGPPGTGKTVTLVEAVKQVWKIFPESHILICTPSNSAANVITQRLLSHIPGKQIFRMCASSYPFGKLPDKVKPCSLYDEQKEGYLLPEKKTIQKQYRIIVTTLVTSGRLVSANFPENYFTHIFIDEAGHSCEPESVIPISLMSSCENLKNLGGHLILAGDPKQLGPIVRSTQAQKYGFDVSLLQRLMESSEIYHRQNGCYDSRVLTKLIRNYRSHPEILKLSNKLFYEGELQVYANENDCNTFCMWEQLPCKGFPLLFHGVVGRDMREARNPSFFNPEEIAIVIEYVKNLLNCKSFKVKVKPQDIGIISPYRRQIQKLQNKIKEFNYCGLSIGSVEEFQGQERKVIIITTVRSSPDLLAMDYEYRLGFLSNPKRFNVALTRAKALLIIVGNPYILSRDRCWRELLNTCCQNGNYVGIPYEPRENSIGDMHKELEETKVNGEVYDGCLHVSHRTLQEEPQWKLPV